MSTTLKRLTTVAIMISFVADAWGLDSTTSGAPAGR
jgi:hypothetical protein